MSLLMWWALYTLFGLSFSKKSNDTNKVGHETNLWRPTLRAYKNVSLLGPAHQASLIESRGENQ
jgi:hypothetical protein